MAENKISLYLYLYLYPELRKQANILGSSWSVSSEVATDGKGGELCPRGAEPIMSAVLRR
jgi:hypothetical protein